jgi:NHLM bacteriocin system ABC transporter peptidase/ATP-binding protein
MSKTPVILESDSGESGAICLAMVLGHYNSYPKLNIVKRACSNNKNEIFPDNLIKVASRFGFNTEYTTNSIEELSLSSPIIIKTTSEKYVLIAKKRSNNYRIHDTEKGSQKITLQQLKDIYDGWSLKLIPNKDFNVFKKEDSFYKELLKRVLPNFTRLIYVLIAGLILMIPAVVVPSFNKLFFDDVITLSQNQWFYPMIAVLSLFIVVGCVLVYLQQWVLLKVELKSSIIESYKYITHILKVPYNYFQIHTSGETVNRLRLNDAIAILFTTNFANAILQIITIFLYGIIMFKYDWLLSLVGVSLMSINIIALRYFSEKRTALNQSLFKDQQKVFNTATNGIEQIETIKASGSENDFFSLWSSHLINSINNQQKLGVTSRILTVLPMFIDELKTIVILLLGGLLIMKGEITIGVFIAIQSFLKSFSKPVNALVEFGAELQESKSDINNLTDSFQEPVDAFCNDELKESIDDVAAKNSKLTGKLEVKNISFGYSQFSEPLIKNFSLTAYPGKRIALIGGSGSGKSTLIKVLSGLYQPLSGEIKYDDKPINSVNKDVLRNSLSFVDQDTFFFKGTISENITMWNNSIDNSRIITSGKDAVIHEFISERKDGYESKVAPAGKNFSGGQRQRLEIARALVTNPSVLFLDEATSALDTETEKLVMNNILKRKCTTITIAHRLSTIKDFDEIIVLERGVVIQRGNHSSLIKEENGLYYKLIKNS